MDKGKENLKAIVKDKYGEIARQTKKHNESSCCGATGCCGEVDYTIFSEDYSRLNGYNPDADLGLGCGLPTEYAGIREGDSVLDLGSGAGNDCFVARSIVGDEGSVTGLDFTDEMLEKANINNQKLGFDNVVFVKGDIEKMPFIEEVFDVVISNCVLNLVPDKTRAFSEIFRVLKKGGHFCVSDVVIKGKLPESVRVDAEMYAGCVAGAIDKDEYLGIISKSGFKRIEIHKEKNIDIPNTIMLNVMTIVELREFKKSKAGIFSMTVSAVKE